jgi:hypothetical protein
MSQTLQSQGGTGYLQSKHEEEQELEIEVDQEQEQEQKQYDEINNSEESDDDGSPSAIRISSVSPSSANMTFNSQVLVNVEEFVYFSVKLGIKFQLLNNNIVVGPYYDGDVPRPVAALITALLAKDSSDVAVALARSTLQVAEALEKEEDEASLHSLSREDFHSVRRQAFSDDDLYSQGLLTASCKNTLLTYPASFSKHSNKHKGATGAPAPTPIVSKHCNQKGKIKRKSSRKTIIMITAGGVEVQRVVSRCRDGSIGWAAVQRLCLTEAGVQEEAAGAAAVAGVGAVSGGGIKSLPPSKSAPELQKPPPPPQLREGDSEDEDEEEREAEAGLQKSSSDQGASWADEQSPEVMTYYINASSVERAPAHAPAINLPQATATVSSATHNSPGPSQVGG